ncbi:acyl carrier protein [Marinomonas piezotolerans]|uniref:Acyl carrier protein n=1 Tax=Marinomonas piezotolerans TaxID=2213058 RepID=A0A370U8V1_9GAMM|nr:acyl carrier protein [Marinomonas piezotolerans]RDL44211.1 acyl carrier protein [Marinomonas piezotolerans]
MTNNERLVATFVTSLNIEANQVVDELEYNTISQWDSVAHMVLVAALEKEFDVMLDMDEIIEMSSVKIAKEILAKHDVVF